MSKNRTKRIASILLAFCLLVLFMPDNLYAEEQEGTDGGTVVTAEQGAAATEDETVTEEIVPDVTVQAAANVKYKCSISSPLPSEKPWGVGYDVNGKLTVTDTKITKVMMGIRTEDVTATPAKNSTGSWAENGRYYNGSVDSASFDLSKADSSLKFAGLPVGTYWYQIWFKDSSGTWTRAKSQEFTVKKQTFTKTDLKLPSALLKGEAFVVSGKITSNFKIKEIKLGAATNNVSTYEGTKWATGCWFYEDSINSTTFNVNAADAVLGFSKLAKGTYRFQIWVRCQNGNWVRIRNTKLTVGQQFTVTDVKKPTELKKGQSFVIGGTVSSTHKIEKVTVGILDAATGKYVSGMKYESKVDGKNFEIEKADSKMGFSKLPEGAYIYRVVAYGSDGTSKRVINQDFNVGQSFVIKGGVYPYHTAIDKDFTVDGTVTSNKSIKKIKIGILTTGGKWKKGQYYLDSDFNKKSFDIGIANKKLRFQDLEMGDYIFRVSVMGQDGEWRRIVDKNFSTGQSYEKSGIKAPSLLAKGKDYDLQGSLSSNRKLTRVKIGVVTTSGKWVSGATYSRSVSTTFFDVSKANSKVDFSVLSPGDYYVRMCVKGMDGKWKRLYNKKLKVMTSFEKNLHDQGFPRSYWADLVKLHKAHPTWKFVALDTNTDWDAAVSAEMKQGNTLNGVAASKTTVAYYMDPRNWLDEENIYQFMDQRWGKAPGGKAYIRRLVGTSKCFLDTDSYVDMLYTAGKESKVNPCVLTAMVIQEQGWQGQHNALINGKSIKVGKKTLNTTDKNSCYDFFNVGAYPGKLSGYSVTASQRGIWFAAGEPDITKSIGSKLGSKTSYGRPWTTKQKSLTGGAKFYAGGYINNHQYTYYTKKFNVANGTGLYWHQYMTNVDGARGEGALLSHSYTDKTENLTFEIPIFDDMPSKKCSR